METENITLRKLTPSAGKYIANRENTICSSTPIYLGKNDFPDNYREVEEAEAKQIIASIKNKMK